MLRCPIDGWPLGPRAIGAASFAVCEKCSGIWFTREALQHPSVDPESLPRASRTPIPTTERRRRIASCPVCHRALLGERVEGIDIDRCIDCDGVWLDPGEYDAVRHRIEQTHRRGELESTAAEDKRFAFGAGDSVELILGLFEIFLL